MTAEESLTINLTENSTVKYEFSHPEAGNVEFIIDNPNTDYTREEAESINNRNISAAIIIFVCLEVLIIWFILLTKFKKKIWYYAIPPLSIALIILQFQRFGEFLRTSENLVSTYFSFICIEFFLYAILVFTKYKRNPLYYVTVFSLMIFPFIRMGQANDFVLRASIPGLFVTYLFVAQYVIDEHRYAKEKHTLKRFCYILLIVFLSIAAVTPCLEMFRNSLQVYEYGIRAPQNDCIYTLGCDGPYDDPDFKTTYANFVCDTPSSYAFFKTFCRRSE